MAVNLRGANVSVFHAHSSSVTKITEKKKHPTPIPLTGPCDLKKKNHQKTPTNNKAKPGLDHDLHV